MASHDSSSAVASSSTSSAVPLFKKKRSRPTPAAAASSSTLATSSAASTSAATPLSRSTGRAVRDNDDDDEEEASSSRPTVVHKVRKVDYSNPLIQSTGFSLAKRNRLAAEQAAEEEGDDPLLREDEYSSVSARVKAGGAGVLGSNRDDATRGVDWFDEEDPSSSKKTSAPAAAGTNDDGVYRGLSSYSSALPQFDHKNKYTQRGPIRAPNNIRTVTVVDYQPDVCKDYKETGYCGFGDTCKFLHDRSDYLAGWQMEAAYLPNSTSRRDLGPGGEEDADDDDDEEEIPFACLICRQPFTDPVQTRCGHYFCSACAIKRFSKTPKCFACGAQTGGIFNSASKVIERMEKRRRDKDEQKREVRKGWGADEDADGAILAGVEVGAQQEDDDA